MNISLSEAGLNERCIIEKIDAPIEEKLRLYDFGFMPERFVMPMYASFLKGIRAYMIKGTLIALRQECSDKISVRLCDE
ncbi:MAG: ferrous iron transport protein A [Firmicutes bacterium]|nr:ferrous iron transport protein A [Bacillota bacterium]